MTADDEERGPFGMLAAYAGRRLPLQVCRSAAGFFIGTLTAEGEPCSRESREYWRDRVKAEAALKNSAWTQRLCP